MDVLISDPAEWGLDEPETEDSLVTSTLGASVEPLCPLHPRNNKATGNRRTRDFANTMIEIL